MKKYIFRAFIIFLITFSFSSVVNAADLAFTGSASFTGTTGVAMPVTDLQISGTTPTSTPVKLLVTNGTLSMTTTTGLTFTGSPTGSVLYFSGTIADINAALATLRYTRSGTGTDTLEASLVDPGEVFFSDNGHLYEYITSTLTWTGAKTAAEALTRYGASGYLATITSLAENNFVSARLAGAGWMGASDAASEGDWKWVTGPETGTSFWSGASGGSAVGGRYANWSNLEPNDSGGNEDCGQFLAGGSGKWNDLPCSGTTLTGYVAEFGATGNMPQVASKNIAISTLSGPLAPTGLVFGTATTTTMQIAWSTGGGSENQFLIEQQQGDCSGSFSQITSISSSLTSYTVTGLSPETQYCFRVRSTDGVTNSAYATTSSYDFTLAATPLKPTLSNITSTSLRVTIPSDGNPTGIALASLYSIQELASLKWLDYPNGSLSTLEGFTSSTAWNNNTLNGLTPNTPYSFRTRVAYRNSTSGFTPYSPTSDVLYTRASVPTSLNAIALSSTAVTLTWSGDGTSYIIHENTLGDSAPVTGNSYTFYSLTCDTQYTFSIKSLNHDGLDSAYSTLVSVRTFTCSGGGGLVMAPVAPSAITPLASTANIPLDFTINGGNQVSSVPEVSVSFNGNPLTVKGYMISVDPTFSGETIRPYAPNASFVLPSKNGVYTVYLKYYSTTGAWSEVLSKKITLNSSSNTQATSTFARYLKLGMKGDDVGELQKFLIDRKSGSAAQTLAKYGVTGYFGSMTKSALIEYQKTQALPPSGYFGPQTSAIVASHR